MIPREVIEEVIRRNDIEQVIGRYVELRRAGSNLVGLCPFHSEKTPSFTVFRNTDSFYCFGCSAGGNVITFVQKIENLDYVSAVTLLAKNAGVEIPDDRSGDDRGPSRDRVLRMNVDAAKFFRACLLEGDDAAPARAYLEKRELSGATQQHFYIGYAPGRDRLVSHLKGLGYSEDEMCAAFLASRTSKGRIYDLFFNRVIFPIVDTSRNIIAFGGRVLDDSKPKYLNTSNTAAFRKSRSLFALNYARGHCAERLLVCEGYMDVVTLHQAGIENAVATLGTSITEEHARLLSRYTKRVILSYDSDEAGVRATSRAMSILDGVGLEVRVLTMSGAKDPDEYVKKFGADAFRRLLEDSSTGFEYKLSAALSRYNLADTAEKIRAVREATEIIAEYPSSVERDIYTSRAAARLEVSAQSLSEDVEKQRRAIVRKYAAGEMSEARSVAARYGDRINTEAVSNVKAVSAEEAVLGLMLIYQEYRDEVARGGVELSSGDFRTSFSRKVFDRIMDLNASEGGFSTPLLGEFFTPDEMGRIESMEMRRRELTGNGMDVFRSAVGALKSAGREDGGAEGSLSDLIAEKRRRLDEERRKRGLGR
jgi:DNA primase